MSLKNFLNFKPKTKIQIKSTRIKGKILRATLALLQKRTRTACAGGIKNARSAGVELCTNCI